MSEGARRPRVFRLEDDEPTSAVVTSELSDFTTVEEIHQATPYLPLEDLAFILGVELESIREALAYRAAHAQEYASSDSGYVGDLEGRSKLLRLAKFINARMRGTDARPAGRDPGAPADPPSPQPGGVEASLREEKATFELWDVETGNCQGVYPSTEEIVEVLRKAVARDGEETLKGLMIVEVTAEGRELVVEEAALRETVRHLDRAEREGLL